MMLQLALSLLLPLTTVPGPTATTLVLQPEPTAFVLEEEEEEQLDPKLVKATAEALEAAFEKGVEVPDRVAAIEAAAAVPHEDVAKALRDGLGDDDLEVVRATLVVLGKMETVERSLDELLRFEKKDKRLKKDEDLFADTLKAISWRGSPETIELLSEDIFGTISPKIIRARIFGLGRCRTFESVEALMGLMKGAAKGKVQPFMDDLRISLSILAGVDHGNSQVRWLEWWSENKRGLEIDEEVPAIHNALQKRWDKYWGSTRAPKEKGGRGGDEEPGERGDD
ncbi:MAG: hypothetical protein P1V81_11175 [Planctomycetota bacterium]|nr:hypothetical protein [Planctomycetota bacterium]